MNTTLEERADLKQGSRAGLRSNCRGLLPLHARLEPWMTELLANNPHRLHNAVESYGSPLNIISTEPFARNAKELERVASSRHLDFRIFFARKANKCLSFVDAANNIGAGIDVASEQECQQVLERGVAGGNVICTAAIKTEEVIELCVRHTVAIALDNTDEMQRVQRTANRLGRSAVAAIRISGFEHHGEKLHSRFGFDVDEITDLMQTQLWHKSSSSVDIVGLHFHLDGYSAAQRVSAIQQCLPLIDHLRSEGHNLQFLDIGGGLPMSYIEDGNQWEAFWAAQENAVVGNRSPITYRNHGLGLLNIDGKIHGRRNGYPYFQAPVRAEWLANVLDAGCEDGTIAEALRNRSVQLRCEPGRSVLDGCGMTVARVEFTKRHRSGDYFIGLAMNRTQCRTSSDDFLVDPLVVPREQVEPPKPDGREPKEGYLVGAYCTESELISLRRLQFPNGIDVGDLVVLPNTAGYFMHFLESRSHQFPLAKNLVANRDHHFEIDWIDQ